MATRSRPCSAIGHAVDWILVGAANPAAARRLISAGGKGTALKCEMGGGTSVPETEMRSAAAAAGCCCGSGGVSVSGTDAYAAVAPPLLLPKLRKLLVLLTLQALPWRPRRRRGASATGRRCASGAGGGHPQSCVHLFGLPSSSSASAEDGDEDDRDLDTGFCLVDCPSSSSSPSSTLPCETPVCVTRPVSAWGAAGGRGDCVS